MENTFTELEINNKTLLTTLDLEEREEFKNMNTNTNLNKTYTQEKGGNKMLETSKIHYDNIYKILNHEEIKGDDQFTPKNFISALRRYIKEEIYGDGLYLLPNVLTRNISSDIRCTGFVSNRLGKYVYFDSGDYTKPSWDNNIKIYLTDNYEIIPKDNEKLVNLKDLGVEIKELIKEREVF